MTTRDLEPGIVTDLDRPPDLRRLSAARQAADGAGSRCRARAASRPRHDEMLFIIQHQTSELWMKLMIHELKAAIALRARRSPRAVLQDPRARQAHPEAALRAVGGAGDADAVGVRGVPSRARHVVGIPVGAVSRASNSCSATSRRRSSTYSATTRRSTRELTALLRAPSSTTSSCAISRGAACRCPQRCVERDWTQPYTRNPELVAVFKTIYDDPEQWWDAYEMAEKLVDVEEAFQLWRFRHMKTVERTIGHKTGTGGSSGVGYLRRALDHAFFPELIDVRTFIGPARNHDDAPRRRVEPASTAAAGVRTADRRRSCASTSRRFFPACSTRSAAASTSPTIRSAGRSTRRQTTCARGSPRGTRELGDAWDDWAARDGGLPRAARRARRTRRAPIASCRRRARGRACARCSIPTTASPRVVATRGEFDSLDVILREYARRGRIDARVRRAGCGRRVRGGGHARPRLARGADLVVVSQVMFQTGQAHAGAARTSSRQRTPRARACSSTSTIRSACFRSTSPRSTSTSRWAAATSTCAAVRARAFSTSPPPSRSARSPRSTSAGSPRSRRSPTRAPILRDYAAGGDAWLESTPAVLAALPGARRTAVHAGDRRRAAARLFARSSSSRLVTLLGRARSVRRKAGRRTAARSSPSSRSAAPAWCDALAGARHRHRCARRVAAPVPRRADDGQRISVSAAAASRRSPPEARSRVRPRRPRSTKRTKRPGTARRARPPRAPHDHLQRADRYRVAAALPCPCGRRRSSQDHRASTSSQRRVASAAAADLAGHAGARQSGHWELAAERRFRSLATRSVEPASRSAGCAGRASSRRLHNFRRPDSAHTY